jgi:hypothetical protein
MMLRLVLLQCGVSRLATQRQQDAHCLWPALGLLMAQTGAVFSSITVPLLATAFITGTDICMGTCSQVRTMAAASSDWLTEDKRLMLHAVYRVGDLEKTEVNTMH